MTGAAAARAARRFLRPPQAAWLAVRTAPAAWRGRRRTAHPVDVLRRRRTGVWAMVGLTALLCLVVSAHAEERIAAARRTQQAIADIDDAHSAAVGASKALEDAFSTGQVELIGTGNAFALDTAKVTTLVTSAAQGNAAGQRGRTSIQFVQGQVTTCVQLADTAVLHYPQTGQAGMHSAYAALTAPRLKDRDTGRVIPGTGGLQASLDDLRTLERKALRAQRSSFWLTPAWVWSMLLAPSAVMLVLAVATARLVARHFRRRVGRQLHAAVALTAAVGVAGSLLGGCDAAHLRAHPYAGLTVTLALQLSALTAAAVLAHFAYRPRLAEYRFRHP